MEATVDPSSPGSRLDADHPENGVLIPCVFTVDFLWRYSTRDGFYQPPGVLLVPSSANTDRFLGEQYNLHAEWQATAHINVNAVYVHFTPAGFLKSAGAKGIDYLGIWTSYMF